jgi:hypothetical protein
MQNALRPAASTHQHVGDTLNPQPRERHGGVPKEERERYPPASDRWNGAAQGRQAEPRLCGTGYRDGRTRRRRHRHLGTRALARRCKFLISDEVLGQKIVYFWPPNQRVRWYPLNGPIAVNSAALFGVGYRGLGAQSPAGHGDSHGWVERGGGLVANTSRPGRCLGDVMGAS